MHLKGREGDREDRTGKREKKSGSNNAGGQKRLKKEISGLFGAMLERARQGGHAKLRCKQGKHEDQTPQLRGCYISASQY